MAADSKIRADLVANYISLFVLGISGLVINFLIGRFLGADSLGVFNQIFTIYIIVSQFSVLGIQFSLLKYLSQYRAEQKPFDDLVSGALVGAFLTSLVVLLLMLLFSSVIAGWFDSSGVEQGILYIVPAIFLLGINKVQINILNGLRAMALFGTFQAIRMIMILGGVAIVIAQGLEEKWLIVTISVAEIVQFFGLLMVTRKHYHLNFGTKSRQWLKEHLSFGIKGVMNGGVSELNSRVDVIVIGVFLSDTAVGIYTMASTVIEGVMQVPTIVRNVINPILSEHWFSGSKESLRSFMRAVVSKFYLAFAVVGILSIVGFHILINYIIGSEFSASIPIFTILMVGLILSSGFMPLDMLPIQFGYPITQSAYKAAVTLLNIVLNVLLIQEYGLLGVAFATGISFVVGSALLGLLALRITR